MTSIRQTIDALSRDSLASDNPVVVAECLRRLYSRPLAELIQAIDDMLADETWSHDREPYQWLRAARQVLAA